MPVSIHEEPSISLNISFIGEQILETRTQKNRPKFLVKWRGRNEHENSWEHLSCLDYINAVLKDNNGLLDSKISIRSEYCWTCKGSETTIDCPTCNRTFHSKCAKTDRLSPNELANWRCDVCDEISKNEEVNRSKNLNLELLNRMLKLILHRIMDDEEFQYFRFPVCKIRRQVAIFTIVNPMNLSMMMKKLDKYKSLAEFFSDLQWIFHYCHAHYADNEEVCKVARRLLTYARNELDSLEMCADCYLRANQNLKHHFTEVCEQPHLLIWAKMKKFPYWPAKLMSVIGNNAKVRFFQDKNNANVPIVDCFIYSREPPSATNQRETIAYANAIQEANMYIENVHKKFGVFNYEQIRTPFHPENLSEHLIAQIPAMKTANPNQVKPKPLVGRRKSIFTIPMLRRKSTVEPPADNTMSRRKSISVPPANNKGAGKIEVRRQTTVVPNGTRIEIKPLDRVPKIESKTTRSQPAIKRKMPQLEAENPAKRTPNPRDILMQAIQLKSKTFEKNGVVMKPLQYQQQQQQQQQQPARPLNGRISMNKTPIKNGGPKTEIGFKTPTTGGSTRKTPATGRSPKTPILPSMPNVIDDDVNGNGTHLPDPRLRPRAGSVYQTRRQLNCTISSAPRVNGLNGAKSKRESMCQSFMLKMQTGLRELVSGLSEEQNSNQLSNKPDAKMKMLLELENEKQLEMIEEKNKSKISALVKSHHDDLVKKNLSHKKQIEDLTKAQFDKVNLMKDKYLAEIKKKDKYILQLQEELNALRNRVAPPKK